MFTTRRDTLSTRSRERLAVRRLREVLSQERGKLEGQIAKSLETVQLMDRQQEELKRMLNTKRLTNQ
jgi:hypothetical protein